MTNSPHSELVLVLGGTGKTGRRIVERLSKRGIKTRIGSRTAERPFDWLAPTTWTAVVQGVSAVYISYQPDLAVPGAVEAVRSFAEVAISNGVEKIVLLSGRGEDEAQRAEEVIKNSGATWTILRASWFSQNFSENFLLDAVLSGEVALPVGDVGEPFIDVEDIADVAVAALTEDGHADQLYELTGPRLLTFAQAVTEIAEINGHPVRFQQLSAEQYSDALSNYGLPKEVVALIMYLFTSVLDGRNAHVTDGVQRALGRNPRDFADYVRDTAATGIWGGGVKNQPVSL